MRYLMFSIPSGTRLSPGLEQKAELSQLMEAAIASGSLLARGDLSPARDEAYVVSTAGKVTVTDGPFCGVDRSDRRLRGVRAAVEGGGARHGEAAFATGGR
jgi:hypothetical protein